MSGFDVIWEDVDVDSKQPDIISVFDAREYGRVLWRHKSVIVVALLVAGAAAGLHAHKQKTSYTSQAQILVQTSASTGSDNGSSIGTEISILQSAAVQKLVATHLTDPGTVTTQQAGLGSVIDVSASGDSAARARSVANAWANAYVKLRTQQLAAQGQGSPSLVRQQLTYLQKQIAKINTEELNGTEHIQALYGSTTSTIAQARIHSLQQTLDPQRAALVTQLVNLQPALHPGAASPPQVQLLSAAGSASSSKPAFTREVVVGAAGGLLLGVLLALMLEWLDDGIDRTDDLVEATGGRVPVLGSLPRLGERRGQLQVVTRTDILSQEADAFNALRTTLNASGYDGPGRRLEIVGVTRGAGATTAVANLAVLMAEAGRPVIMVDCALRWPHLHSLFGLPNTVGLTSVLAGDVPASAALQPVPGSEQLFLMSAGTSPPNPAEVLSSPSLSALFDELTSNGATLLIDCSSVLSAPDAAAVAVSGHVDALVLVAAKGSHQRELRRSVEVLAQVGAEPVGLVMTKSDEANNMYGSRRSTAAMESPSAEDLDSSSAGAAGAAWRRTTH